MPSWQYYFLLRMADLHLLEGDLKSANYWLSIGHEHAKVNKHYTDEVTVTSFKNLTYVVFSSYS